MVDNKSLTKIHNRATATMRPQHTISYSKKKSTEAGEASEWGMNAVDYYSQQSSISTAMRNEMRVLYRLASGYLDEADYSHVLNPLGAEQRKRESLQGDPAKLRNYDIISSVVSRIVGDFLMRDTNYQVIATNTDVEDRRQEEINSMMKQMLIQQFRNQLAQQGMDTGFSDEEVGFEVDQILAQAENIPDTMTMKGQDALDYVIKFNETERKIREGLIDYLTVGRVFSYRDVFRNDTVYETVNTMEFDYLASENEEFVENGECANRKMYLPITEVIDLFRDELTDAEINYLENHYGGHAFSRGSTNSPGDIDTDWRAQDVDTFYNNVLGARRNQVSNGVPVTHTTFRSKKKLGLLTGINPFGEIIEIEVDEDYKPRAFEDVRWVWVDEIWEGYKIADFLFKRVGPIPLQRGTANEPSACKLPYNGRTYGHRTSLPNTPVKMGKPYQEMYNILKYRTERTIAKNKDKVVLFPYGLVPESKDLDMFSMMHYADTTSFLYVDDSDPKAAQSLQHVRSIDLSMRDYIKYLHDISMGLRAEFLELVGIPRQAMADIKASDDVGNTNQALNQSALILESMFISFEEFVEKDYLALLELSKFAWIDGKKEKFLNPGGELTWLDIDPFMHAASDFSVFVKGNKKERERLREMRALTQAFAQNSATPTMIGRILQANNFDTLMRELEKMEKKIEQSNQQAQQAEQQQAQIVAQGEQAKMEYNYYKTDTDNQTKENVAYINNQGALATSLLQATPTDNGEAINKGNEALDDLYSRRDESNLRYADIQAKREKSINDVKIAKENKTQHELRAGK